jgi:hypothetical protein
MWLFDDEDPEYLLDDDEIRRRRIFEKTGITIVSTAPVADDGLSWKPLPFVTLKAQGRAD